MKTRIPKIIHYCWFGGKEKPEAALKCIESWRKYFPDYEIREWNESNYDVFKASYSGEAYLAGKYAFVSDFARFDILFRYGGIYFDTDVEVIRPFADILQNNAFTGMEEAGRINPGLGIGAIANFALIGEIASHYSSLYFIKKDGSCNLQTVVEYTSSILKKKGLKNSDAIQNIQGLRIYPSEFFSPKSNVTGLLKITGNTRSIHHYNGSWIPGNAQSYYAFKRFLCRKLGRRFGTVFAFPALVLLETRNNGIRKGITVILAKLKRKYN
jgi:hypothetical protein